MTRPKLAPVAALTAAIATLIAYLPATGFEFLTWDDGSYVLENPHIRSLDFAFLRWAFAAFHAYNWHPLTWVSHAIDYAIWGLNPFGHHLTNIVLHALNTFLSALLTASVLEAAGRSVKGEEAYRRSERGIAVAAGVTGFLFGLHPLHVESAAWVAERKDLLCATFFILSCAAYIRHSQRDSSNRLPKYPGCSKTVRSSHPQEAPRRRGESGIGPGETQGSAPTSPYKDALDDGGEMAVFQRPAKPGFPLLSFSLFILALMSKPMAVTLPVVLLLLDHYPLGRISSFHGLVLLSARKIPFFVSSAAVAWLTLLAQKEGGALVRMKEIPLETRIPVAFNSVVEYLRKMIVPVDLFPFYQYPSDATLFSMPYHASAFMVVATTLLALAASRKKKKWLTAWGYYLVTLLPVLGLVQVGGQAMADRYSYLPSLAPFAVIGAATASALSTTRPRLVRGAAIVVAGGILALFGWLTVHQEAVWKDSLTFWNDVIERHPSRLFFAYNNRGLALYRKGRYDEAIADYTQAIALNPELSYLYNNRGIAHRENRQHRKAMNDFRMALNLDPSNEAAMTNLVRLASTVEFPRLSP